MNVSFLSNFMRVALEKTDAERALTVDEHLTILDSLNFEADDLLSENFQGLETIRKALDSGEPIITNNAVRDVSNAPNTNTNFSNLRVIVVIPVKGHGAVYLDQPVRKGIIPKETVNRLMTLGGQVAQTGDFSLNTDQLGDLYQQMV